MTVMTPDCAHTACEEPLNNDSNSDYQIPVLWYIKYIYHIFMSPITIIYCFFSFTSVEGRELHKLDDHVIYYVILVNASQFFAQSCI